eukprot:Skav211390  [mRNA]  locus=scaffold1873:61809:72389:+ [translate_table: standard]
MAGWLAKNGRDYERAEGELRFAEHEMAKEAGRHPWRLDHMAAGLSPGLGTKWWGDIHGHRLFVTINILESCCYDHKEDFRLIFYDATGGAKFDPDTDGGEDSCIVTVVITPHTEPWRSKVDALLRCDSDVHFGRIIEVNDSGFLIEEALLEPFRGLTIDPHGATCAVSFPDAAGFSTGAWIGYSGLRDNDGIRTIQDGSIVWLIPSGDASTQVSTIQMFSGAYDGWSRAFAWLKHEGILDSIRTIKIDHDQGVSNVWAKEEVPILRDVQVAGIQPNFSAFSGTVDNRKWFNLLRSDDFTFMTLSPPCQPWSRGGRGTGLHSANGMSFLQAIAVVGQTRPQLVGCECADLIVHHDHFPVLKHAFLAQGYVMHWSTVTDIAQLTGCQRKRWLALFVRRDVQTLPVFGTFKISDTQVPKWSNDCFQFAVPDEIVEQLRLTPEQLHMYSQVQWFPPNKRHTLPANPTPADVLEARRLQPSAIMPTLCASYSQQHTLNREHLDTKGIFASLVECDGHWSFLSPLMFCGIFGTPQDQIVVLPVNIADSFKQLGNCIAPPHALLVILVGLSATAVFKQSIKQMIIKCYQNRMTPANSHVISNDDFIWVVADSRIEEVVTLLSTIHHDQPKVQVSIGDHQHSLDATCSFSTFIDQLGFCQKHAHDFKVYVDDAQVPLGTIVAEVSGSAVRITCRAQVVAAFSPLLFEIEEDRQATIEVESSQDSPVGTRGSFCSIEWPDLDLLDQQTASDPPTLVAILRWPEQTISYVMSTRDTAIDHVSSLPSCADCIIHKTSISVPLAEAEIVFICIRNQVAESKACVVVQDNCVMKFGLMCLDRSFVPAHLWPSSFGCTINDVPTPCDQSCVISSGDVLTVWGLQSERSAYSIANGPCLASDEAMWFALEINKTESNTFIMAPVILFTHDVNLDEALHRPIVSVGEAFFASVAQGRTPPICRLRGLILFSAHWFGLEVTFGDITEVKLVGCQDSQMSQIISTGIAGALRSVGMIVATTFVEFPAVHGLCGWALLHTWIQDHGPLPEWCDVDAPTIDAARLSFANLEDPASPVGRFACVVRSQFLQQQRTATGRLHFGGAENDDKKDTDMKQDPLQVADPWKMPTSNKQKQQGARWEDLVLPDDHPFFCKSGERMFQVQRQRINGKNGGLAFSTKSNIQSVLAANTTVDSALLVPVSDRSVFAKLCPVPSVSGPYEITVKDPIIDQLYKRQVLVVQVKGDIIFKLTGDGYKAKLNVLRELVFEFDSRLVNKDVTQHMVQSPLENMKQKVADQFGLKDISLYGFRKQSKESEHVFMQIIGKVDSALRPNILEKSGLNELTVRDFVQKGDSPNDHSVIPRFFPMTKQGKDEAIRSSVGVTGFAGVLLTRRGVGVRCWHKNIGAMRQALMASDMRICSENLNTVPRIARESVGWPQNITPQEVVRACMHSVGQAPVPTKCYRSLGVVAWTLMFASEPSCTKFTATFNDETVEVLLLPTGSQIKPSQPRSKPKKGAAPPASQPHDEATTDRITALESRFSVLERRQDTIENRVQSGFDAVQDQLRQVLTAVAPRNQAQDSTGHTPPQKVARSS